MKYPFKKPGLHLYDVIFESAGRDWKVRDIPANNPDEAIARGKDYFGNNVSPKYVVQQVIQK